MGRINRANLKKTIYYLKRNGLRNTWYAVRERLDGKSAPPYVWTPPSEEELADQRRRWETRGFSAAFSILVPAHRTKPEYLRELIDSLVSQTYPRWELILADATEDDSVERAVRKILNDEGLAMEGAAFGGSMPMEPVLSGGSVLTEPVPGGGRSGKPAACAGDSEGCAAGMRTDGSHSHGHGSKHPDSRIRYIHLSKNAGIAENTNQALPCATGDYVGLLDHDDILTPDALYEMAEAIEAGKRQGQAPKLLYSDEDKCNGDRTEYYEPNFKEDFNLNLLLSNNYICHFLVMERELIQKLKFRHEFEGAQDYDLVLRAVAELGAVRMGAGTDVPEPADAIVHIPKVLYHWRCHAGSTAENPGSKRYAYESGRLALQDFADRQGWAAKAVDTAHVGFYALEYDGDIFESRADIGAIGGRLVHKGRVCGGRMTEEGRVLYENLPVHYSGYLHRGALSQDAAAVDLRNMKVRPECRELFRRITGVSYRTRPGGDVFDVSLLPAGSDVRCLSLKLCAALKKEGYRILYLPDLAEGKR